MVNVLIILPYFINNQTTYQTLELMNCKCWRVVRLWECLEKSRDLLRRITQWCVGEKNSTVPTPEGEEKVVKVAWTVNQPQKVPLRPWCHKVSLSQPHCVSSLVHSHIQESAHNQLSEPIWQHAGGDNLCLRPRAWGDSWETSGEEPESFLKYTK